jgi:hypothetical protein
MRRSPRVAVTIDRLVLRGFPAEQRDAIAGGLVAELERALAGLASARNILRNRSTAVMVAHPIAQQVHPRRTGSQAARRIAAALHGAKASKNA